MKLFQQIFNKFKEILFIPRNLSNITRQLNNLVDLENKLEAVSKKLNDLDLDSFFKKIDTLSQIQTNNNNNRKKEYSDFEISELLSHINENFENQFLQFESLFCIYNSLPNLKFLPATRGWAGSPDFLAKIIEIIFKEKPRFVLEASSGVSTIIIGLAMKLNNYGNLISLDHERFYEKITTENIKVNEIEDNSNVMHCPLRDYNIFEQTWKWYETDNLSLTERIDLLIIDGPPRSTQFLARYPAVPLLHDYFSDRVLILLDDSNRNDETIIVQKWISFLENINFKVVVSKFNNFEKGMVILEVCRIERPQ